MDGRQREFNCHAWSLVLCSCSAACLKNETVTYLQLILSLIISSQRERKSQMLVPGKKLIKKQVKNKKNQTPPNPPTPIQLHLALKFILASLYPSSQASKHAKPFQAFSLFHSSSPNLPGLSQAKQSSQ